MLHKSFFDTVLLLCHIASDPAVVFPAVLTVSTRYFIGEIGFGVFVCRLFFFCLSISLSLSSLLAVFLSYEHLVLCSGCVCREVGGAIW